MDLWCILTLRIVLKIRWACKCIGIIFHVGLWFWNAHLDPLYIPYYMYFTQYFCLANLYNHLSSHMRPTMSQSKINSMITHYMQLPKIFRWLPFWVPWCSDLFGNTQCGFFVSWHWFEWSHHMPTTIISASSIFLPPGCTEV